MTIVIEVQTKVPVVLEVHYRALEREDMSDHVAMLGRCSRTSRYRRFHGVTDGVAYARSLAGRTDHESLAAWAGSRCVGVATLAGPSERLGLDARTAPGGG
jgi:hypothetical protein